MSLGTTSYTDTQLSNGEHYFYRVTAVNAAGEGPYAGTDATTFSLPQAPVLQVEASGPDMHLSWTASDGAAYYRIYRGDAAGQESYLKSVQATSYVDGPFVAGRTLYYYVTAVNAAGEGGPSNEANATIVTFPSAPTDLVVSISGTEAVLNWEAPLNDGGSPVLSYQVLRGLSQSTEVVIGTSNTLEYNDTTVVSGKHYFYQVKAVNAAGTGSASNTANLFYSDTFTSPQLTATAGLGRVTLRWTSPTGTNENQLTGYRLYRGTTSGSESFLIGVNVTELADTGVTIGQIYYYKVCGVTAIEEGPASNEANATPYIYPGVPTDFNVTGADTSATLKWSAPITDGFTPLLGYHVFRGTEAGNLSQVDTVSGLGYKDTGLAAGTTDDYKITAYNAAGDGGATPEMSITTVMKTETIPPIGLTAIAAEGKVTLQWNPPTGVEVFTYSIFRGNDSGGEVFLTNYPLTSWVDNNITSGKTYYYKVSAMTTQGDESQMSEEAVATPVSSHTSSAAGNGLLDQMWFRIVMIMTILVVGFFSFVLFVRKGTVQVKRDK